jgi:hypothetical protein
MKCYSKRRCFPLLAPSQFQVNEVWIALRANDDPFFVQDAPYDCHVLMDAGSAYALGHVLAPRDGAPDGSEVVALLDKAWRGKRQWAQRLIVTGDGEAESVFRTQAEEKGLPVEIVPVSEMTAIVGPLKESFGSMFVDGNT